MKGTIDPTWEKIHNSQDWGGYPLCFGEEMAGYRTGEEFEHNTFKNIKEGNLSDRGITHIYTETEIIELLSVVGFRDIHCDWIKYLDKGEMVHQYVCTGVK